jgi:hypothetical protein
LIHIDKVAMMTTTPRMQVLFDIPPLSDGELYEARLHMYGHAGLRGPRSETAEATLRLFGAPREGTLSGTALQRGNLGGDLLPTKGHFMCDVRLKPIVHRFQPPPQLEELEDTFGDAAAPQAGCPAEGDSAAGDGAAGGDASAQAGVATDAAQGSEQTTVAVGGATAGDDLAVDSVAALPVVEGNDSDGAAAEAGGNGAVPVGNDAEVAGGERMQA